MRYTGEPIDRWEKADCPTSGWVKAGPIITGIGTIVTNAVMITLHLRSH